MDRGKSWKGRRALAIGAALFVWAVALAGGWHVAMRYETTPGQASAKSFSIGKHAAYTWVLVAHPLCPCTRASLTELQNVAEKHEKDLRVKVVFAGSERGSNWDLAQQIPNVEVATMSAAEAAKRYDAHTSGQTFMFSPSGRLVFSGGITQTRGHEDLDLAERIFEQTSSGKALPNFPVYGCALGNETL